MSASSVRRLSGQLPSLRRILLCSGVALLLLLAAEALRQHRVRHHKLEASASLAQGFATKLSQDLAIRLEKLESIARSFSEAGLSDPSALRGRLEAFQKEHPLFAWLGITNLKGQAVAATGGLLTGVDLSARPWFRGGLLGSYLGDVHHVLLLAPFLQQEGGSPLRFIDLAVPVRDAAGNTIGVLGGHMNWQWASRLGAAFLGEKLDTSSELLILDNSGSTLLGPPSLQGHLLEQKVQHAIPYGGASVIPWNLKQTYVTSGARLDGLAHQMLQWSVVARDRLQPSFLAWALCVDG